MPPATAWALTKKERVEVAAAIIELASMGERNPGKLFALAIEALDVSDPMSMTLWAWAVDSWLRKSPV